MCQLAIEVSDRMQAKYVVALTAVTEASADAIHALLAVDLVDDDLAALQHASLDVGRIVEQHASAIASDGGYGRNGDGLTINKNGVTMSGKVISFLRRGAE